MNDRKEVCVVIGAGVATGSAIARAFAREGYTACLSRRKKEPLLDEVEKIEKEGGQAHAFALDATDEDAVVEMFAEIEQDIGPIGVAVYNAGIGAAAPIAELSAEDYERVWRTNAFGAFLMGREAARVMQPRGKGTILLTGATAALRGKQNLAAFAGSKHALRALAQSMARELFPQNIHVCHMIIDGPIDTPLIRKRFPKVFEDRPKDGVLLPDDIARVYVDTHNQPRSAWADEIAVRPWKEPW